MNTDLQTPSPDDDAWLDRTLRAHPTDDYIDDVGFTIHVVAALPQRNRRRAWLLASATLVGLVIAAWFGLLALDESLAHIDWRFPTQLAADPAISSYVVLTACLLLAGGSTWWALGRRHTR